MGMEAVDLQKVFTSVSHQALWAVLLEQVTHLRYTKLSAPLHNGPTRIIQADAMTIDF